MLKLLIVDDQKKEREGISGIIDWESIGIIIAGEASNGREGLNRAIELRPEIIITDVVMPYSDGFNMIEEIKKILPGTKFIFVSCYSDFKYAQKAMQLNASAYILKPIIANELQNAVISIVETCNREKQKFFEDEQLEKQLKESIPFLRNNFLKNLVFGLYKEEEAVWENIKFLSLDIDISKNFNILLIEIDDYYEITKDYSPMKKQLLYLNLINIAEEYTIQKKIGYLIPINESHIVILIFLPGQESDFDKNRTVIDFATYLHGNLKQRLGLSLTIGIGTFTENIMDLEQCYKQAEQTANLKFNLGKGSVLKSEDRLIETKPINFNAESLQHEVKTLLTTGSSEDIKRFLDSHFISGIMTSSGAYTQFLCTSIINFAQLVLLEVGENLKSIFDNENIIYEKLFHLETIIDMKQWMTNVLIFLQEFMGKRTDLRKKRIVDQIKKIVQESCNIDLSIIDIANHVYLSPSYTSLIFKQETGESIIEYLIKLRMEKAMQLLKNPSLKVYDVAEKVGYTNKSYFCLVFKEKTGMTPKEYRDKVI